MMSTLRGFRAGCAGLTALEIVIAVCVVLGLSALTAKPITHMVYRIRVHNAADGIKRMVQNARMRAIASPDRYCGVVFRFHAAGSAVNDSVFSFLDANPSNKTWVPGQDQTYLSPFVVPRKQGIAISIPAGFPSELVFRADGSASASAKVVLTLKGIRDTLDVLASTGRVKVVKK